MIAQDFHLLAPLDVTEIEIVSGIPDAENQVFDISTTYAEGDLVWYLGHVYMSVAGSNLGNTPGGAEWTDLGEIDQGADIWDMGTTYTLNEYVVYQGALWKSSEDPNLDNTPSSTSTSWTRQGATTRLKPFDGFLQDAAELTASPITYTMSFADLVTDLAILRASGTEARVTMTDATDGLVYDETFPLQDDSTIIDAWEYCFGPFVFIDTVLVEGLPPYVGADVEITIDGTNTSVAQMVFGLGLPLGTVKVGTGVGIESYSVKDRDDFNRSIVVSRPYSDTVDFNLAIETELVGYVKRRLAEREALATLYYMSGGASFATVAYGFFQNFDILHSDPTYADCVLEIEGLG